MEKMKSVQMDDMKSRAEQSRGKVYKFGQYLLK